MVSLYFCTNRLEEIKFQLFSSSLYVFMSNSIKFQHIGHTGERINTVNISSYTLYIDLLQTCTTSATPFVPSPKKKNSNWQLCCLRDMCKTKQNHYIRKQENFISFVRKFTPKKHISAIWRRWEITIA